MPKKTKKQKLISELRRKLDQVKTVQTTSSLSTVSVAHKAENKPTASFTYQALHAKSDSSLLVPKTHPFSTTNYTYVTADIQRILTFTVFAFIFQLSLYYVISHGGNTNLSNLLPRKLF